MIKKKNVWQPWPKGMDLTPNPAAADATSPVTRRDFVTACKAWQTDLASSLKILASESNQARDLEIFGC